MTGSNFTRNLQILGLDENHKFLIPSKKIHDGNDVAFWLTTCAYTDIMTFILQLNVSMFPRKLPNSSPIEMWELNGQNVVYSSAVSSLRDLLSKLEEIIEEAPPDPGPRRFGNVSFRKWHSIVEERINALLEEHLPHHILEHGSSASQSSKEEITAKDELRSYLMGSFGSSQRLDYGTGHELSFLAFLGCIWKLNGFPKTEPGAEERAIVLGVIEPYLHLIRRLILTYTLEPAGSHGVWGLDDHSFLPYIFGSAQYSPAMTSPADVPGEGSAPDAPKPGDVTKKMVIERERKTNMYFSAIGFIYDVKTGPFWEHSPILFDISGVTAGWAKINKGMIKMYNAEVLSKFPVVQHFPFGSFFAWEKDPKAQPPLPSTHTANQPMRTPAQGQTPNSTTMRPPTQDASTKAPWISAPSQSTSGALPGPSSSRAAQSSALGMPATRAPWASATARRTPQPPPPSTGTAAPWARPAPVKPPEE